MNTAVATNTTGLTVWTPITTLPMLTSSAWMTFITANSSQRPKYACRTVRPSTSSSSTSSLNSTINTNPAIHSDRLVNRGAIDEP